MPPFFSGQRRRKMAIFKGSGVALVTPFAADGKVDYPKLKKLCDYHVENGTDAIIICGTTGESSTLSEAEHIDVIAKCVKYVGKRIPVVAGTGSNDTNTAIYLSKEAEKAGADACLLVTPYYNKATQKGLIAHFTAIANSISLPCILYNVPSRTGCNILPETAVTLARNVENIVAIKEASGSISQVAKLASIAEGCIDIYSGNDDQVTPLLSLGGIGVISVLANVAPRETHEMVASYLAGDVKKSAEIQLKSIELCDALFCEVNPIPVKAALDLMGWDCGTPRLPLTTIEDAHLEQLKKAMKNYGLI